MNLQIRLFPWSVLLNIALIIALFFIFRANSSNQQSAALDRDILLKGNSILKADLKASKDSIKAERLLRSSNDSVASKEQTIARTEIERLKRKERGLRGNPEVITLIDTIFAEYDTALMRAEQKSDDDSLSFEREIRILEQSHKDLTTAYDSTFSDLLSTNDRLISALKKVEELKVKNKVVTWVAVLEAVGIVILALLL